jgi:hypothetical protein
MSDVEAWPYKNYLSLSVPELLAVSEISLISVVSKQIQQMLPKACYKKQQATLNSVVSLHKVRVPSCKKNTFMNFYFS